MAIVGGGGVAIVGGGGLAMGREWGGDKMRVVVKQVLFGNTSNREVTA